MGAVEHGLEPCCHLFQMFASNVHQNEWFRIQFVKPLPRPLPFFSRAFDSGFAFDSWVKIENS